MVDLHVGYGSVQVLENVSIDVPRGAFVCVIGPNGAGKSTLLKSIYGIVPASSGHVWLWREGERMDLVGLRAHELTSIGLNYVPQLDNVFPSMSVIENLEMGMFLDRKRFKERVEEIFDWFPLLKDRRTQRAGLLSGGERQSLALARTLMPEPRILLLDEPSAGLSPRAIDYIFERIAAINDDGVTIMIVEQDARRSLAMSDYGYVLDLGRNAHEGPGASLLNDPQVVDLYLGTAGRLSPDPVNLKRRPSA